MTSYANQTIRLQKQSLPSFPTQTSFTQLFGDTFATQAADSLYLLEDLTGIGATLDNPNAATFDSITDLTIKPVNVGTFDGVDQFLSTPTAVANQVGVGSFVASIWFKTTATSTNLRCFQYGDRDAGEQWWGIAFASTGIIQCQIDAGPGGVVSAADPIANVFQDGKWHLATMIVDRQPTVNLMTLLVDGKIRATADITVVVDTLDNPGTNLYIGAGNNAGVDQFFNGQESNFSLYIADAADNTVPPDYNIPSLLEAGLRENAIVGNWTLSSNSGARISNNSQSTTDTQGDYTTSVINVSEGIYDIISLYPEANARGTMDVSIDGEVVFSQNQNAGSTSFNQSSFGTGIYISAGTHILKVGSDTTTGTTHRYGFQMLELIKRDGPNEGDNECSSGNIFGDEIIQRSNASQNIGAVIDNGAVFNQQFGFIGNSTANVDQYIEGDIFIKKGLYKITHTYYQGTTRGIIDIFFGGVKVFDQLDMNGALQKNTSVTREAFLEGGKTTVRGIITGTTSSDFVWIMNNLRFELVSGKSNGDNVNIWAADDDFGVVSGATPELSEDISERFNQNRGQNVSADQINDEILYPRYFSGGTYKVKWLTVPTSLGGVCDVYWDEATNLIFDNTSLNSVGGSTIHETTVTIPRGIRDIHIKTVADGGTNAFLYIFTLMQFTKIADIESTEDDNSDPVHGSTVLLAKHKSAIAEGDVTLNMGGVDFGTKYSKVIVIYDMSPSAQLNLQMQVSGLTGANYTTDFTRLLTGTLTGENQTVAGNADIATNQIIPFGGGALDGEIEIVSNVDTTIRGFFKASFGNIGVEDGMWHYNAAVPRSLSEFRLFTSTSTWGVGATIEIYGVLK